MIAPIDIKVTLDDVPGALTALGLTHERGRHHDIWFAEVRPGVTDAPFPLLSNHLIIRIRSGDTDDLTVALRPCRQGQLAEPWTRPFDTDSVAYRLNWELSGTHKVLTASAVSERPKGSLATQMASGTDPLSVLDPAQRQFVVTCTPVGVPVDHLRALGPVSATTWPGITIDQFDVVIDRWAAGDVDLLELCHQVVPRQGEGLDAFESRAFACQQSLTRSIRRRGLHLADTEVTTECVLAGLTGV
ncbi:hypothetical protein GTV32_04270 [Gordonia sp. SID5947]|uniref:hypothetical protein n=1 Tax=Gordonia sp. SID5947 TaxID=2690315 RepID=UPI00136B048D|nr:hypothetical protein [Gordonia sp. SID5947]MYR05574.1 hypothetical protein [Gordonia sp. SID5947]